MNIFAFIAEQKIEEAIRNGEFDNLPGAGKPLDLDDDLSIPEDMRLANRIMKNSGLTPPEVSLRKEIANLREELARTENITARHAIEREIRMLCLRIATLKEHK
jgi:hypothetical protein